MNYRRLNILKEQLPSLLFISGMPGVGKSTIAHNILINNPDYIIIEEVDIIREALRGYINLNSDVLNISNNYKKIINCASYELNFEEFLYQCKILQPSILAICLRLQRKKIPAIIEGVNLDYISMYQSLEINFLDFLCINFHISDEKRHHENLLNKYIKDEKFTSKFEDTIVQRSKLCYDRLNIFISQNSGYRIFNIDLSTNACNPSLNKQIKNILAYV